VTHDSAAVLAQQRTIIGAPLTADGCDWSVLGDALLARARTDGDRLAFDDTIQRISFAQLAERATARAQALAERGVGLGDRVALVLPAGVTLVELFWALQLLGAVPCVLNPADRALARRVALVAPRLVVDIELAGGLSTHQRRGTAASFPSAGLDDLAFIQTTSGTSGAPRAAQVRHRNALAFLHAARLTDHVHDHDVLVAWVPPWHDLGLVRFVIGPVFHGAACHIVQPAIRTLPEWLQTISRVGATVSGAPDFCYRIAARMVDPATVDLCTLRHTTNGGEPVRRSSIEEFEARFGVPGVVAPGYGMAEVTLGVTAHVVGEPLVVDERGNVSCGLALPGLEVRAGAHVDAPEEITIRGAAVFAGYLDAPQDNAERLKDGWLQTGDSGYIDDAGRLFVLGRRRGMIKRGGAVVAPRELEEAAQAVPAVRVGAAFSAAAGAQDKDMILVVVEVAEGDGTDAVAADVSRTVAEQLGFAPDRVIVAPPRTIPRTDNGKIRHDELRSAFLAGQFG
jgi:acyl-CoA synthetase (AMP-forming)/AMP-acid ligase II